MTGAQKAGLKYERAACDYLRTIYGDFLYEGVWFRYVDCHGVRYCQSDAIVANPETNELIIFEMKLKHAARAWWQLHTLYKPVVEFAFGNEWSIKVVEMTNVHDPIIQYPTPINLTRRLDSLENFPTTNILIWRG